MIIDQLVRKALDKETQAGNDQREALAELLRESANVAQYVAKVAADHRGHFMGHAACVALRRLESAIDRARRIP